MVALAAVGDSYRYYEKIDLKLYRLALALPTVESLITDIHQGKVDDQTLPRTGIRLRPDRYGDRITSEISGPGGKDLIPERATNPQRVAHALLLLLQSAGAAGEDDSLAV